MCPFLPIICCYLTMWSDATLADADPRGRMEEALRGFNKPQQGRLVGRALDREKKGRQKALKAEEMPHTVLATADGQSFQELELDDVTLMFFDTLMATLKASFAGDSAGGTAFDFFEYIDEDGDSLAVRTDEELQTFLIELLQSSSSQSSLKIRLRSSRSPMRQQISFDESDDVIMASLCCATNTNDTPSTQPSPSVAADPPPTAAAVVGPEDLQLIERLSDGQFGTVYKALDVRNDRLLAVKCIAMDNTSGTRQALLNEIAILKKSSHPNIVTFHAAMFIENQLLIYMELMDALSLDLYGQLPPPVLGAVSVAVVEGLAHLWSRSIMHRDIKPSNFLVNSLGEVKLGDFGVSKQMAQSMAWSYVGTKVYMAPERLGGQVYNVASDVWSLGLSLAELALGRFPFSVPATDSSSTTYFSPIESLLFSPDRIGTICNDPVLASVSDGFATLVDGCLALNPKQRIGPSSIVSSQFIEAHRPMNQQKVGQFVVEKRREKLVAQQNHQAENSDVQKNGRCE